MAHLTPSSSTSGFFQALPTLPPQYTWSASEQATGSQSDDRVLARVLNLYLPDPPTPQLSKHFHDFSRLVLHPSTLQHTVNAETNQPTLHPLTTFGEINTTDPLRTSEGWRSLKHIQTQAGIVGYGYPQYTLHQTFNRRIHQFATLHLWHGTAALATCPMAMTDGAAVLLRRHLDDPDHDQPGRKQTLTESYRRLTSLDSSYAWTSGQWMTERTGGSDVSNTETTARRMTPSEIQSDLSTDAHGLPLGPWLINGFKWFSSATDADMAVLLAQTSKGLSAFYAPLRRQTPTLSGSGSQMNGVRPQRLKSKLGTKGLPTAELEIKNMRAFLIGTEGQGVKEISSILNITRLHTASGGAGYLSRGLAVSRAYTQVREVRGGLLADNPQHLSWMATETVKYTANTNLVFLGVALLGASEQGDAARTPASSSIIPKDKNTIDVLLRILTPVMKAQVTLNSVSGLQACMESLGGVGYCENNEDGGVMNIARLFRDAAVGPIWEGTTSVMAEDVLRVIKNPKVKTDVLDQVFGEWTRAALQAVRSEFPAEVTIVENRYAALKQMVGGLKAHELHRRGREVLEHIEAVACACLLMYDACLDKDEVAMAIAKRWVRMIALPSDTVQGGSLGAWEKEVELDRRIFLGSDTLPSTRAQARL
ncbi:acyl-CoA dehydrogenase [Exophiala viscosa]|uniref:acyl-CoA dehydrogenase n=1 Tax=Exophiala viscosa TaxID=2486360 RepID=UPI00218D334C|nr:acyl-CoA dehydrogenase [Exophiala viscosa]